MPKLTPAQQRVIDRIASGDKLTYYNYLAWKWMGGGRARPKTMRVLMDSGVTAMGRKIGVNGNRVKLTPLGLSLARKDGEDNG